MGTKSPLGSCMLHCYFNDSSIVIPLQDMLPNLTEASALATCLSSSLRKFTEDTSHPYWWHTPWWRRRRATKMFEKRTEVVNSALFHGCLCCLPCCLGTLQPTQKGGSLN